MTHRLQGLAWLAESPLPDARPSVEGSPYRLQTAREGQLRGVPGLPWAQQYDYDDQGGFDDTPHVPAALDPSPLGGRAQGFVSPEDLNARANQLARKHRVSIDAGRNDSGNEKYIHELREQMHALIKITEKLEEENAALKDMNMRSTMDDVIQIQKERMIEREKAADDLVNHWKNKVEKLEEVVSSGYLEELEEKVIVLQSKVNGLEMEKDDMDLSIKEKESRIVELQKRNAFLEKYARVYPTTDAGIATDAPQRKDVGIQAPHAVAQHRAMAMAPEGVPSDSMYTYGAVDAAGPHFGGIHRGHQERTYELMPQATIPHQTSRGTSSVGIAQGTAQPGIPGTKESRRRPYMPPPMSGPLLGTDGQPRQIEFYSGSQSEKSLAQVSAAERQLLLQFGLDAEVSGEAVVYKHPPSGFIFKLSRAEMDDDDDESGSDFDLEYEPIAWGVARAAIGRCPKLEDQLLEKSYFKMNNRNDLLTEIGTALRGL
jgi:hypothetical protein